MFSNRKIFTLGLLLLITIISNAQSDKIANAVKFYQANNLDSAKLYIDEAIKNQATENDAQAWYIRGFIYKEIYTKREAENKQSTARTEALYSFKKSLSIDTTKENVEENKKNIKFLAYKFFNDAASSLDTINYEIAIINFQQYKSTMLIIDSSLISQKELEFNLAIGSVYTKLFETDRKASNRFLDLAKVAYSKVLSIDPNNISANYNMGILYYNQAVHLIKEMDYDIDMVSLSDIQDNSIVLFKESLPFMEKAYELDPNRKETLQGLSGIYFSLNDFEKSNAFKQKLEKIEK